MVANIEAPSQARTSPPPAHAEVLAEPRHLGLQQLPQHAHLDVAAVQVWGVGLGIEDAVEEGHQEPGGGSEGF